MSDAVDLARLEGFTDGTINGMRQVIELFLEEGRETVAALTAAATDSDRAGLTRLAHRLGGSCAAVGAGPLAARLLELERRGPTAPRAELASLMAGVEREFETMTRFLTVYLEGHTR
jgi:HPt (histidine-containing phosphotransfer) domain-containing protein